MQPAVSISFYASIYRDVDGGVTGERALAVLSGTAKVVQHTPGLLHILIKLLRASFQKKKIHYPQ